MIEVRRYDELGTMNIDWLNAHYHFSFANYHDPKRMGVGPLRVINDDIVSAGGGFDFHPHKDMEIVTYVREGAITHEDSLGNRGVTRAGDVQVMSAGTGITHAEWNEGKEPICLYQIWLQPRHKGNTPRWDSHAFPKDGNGLMLLASGRKEDGALYIDADAAIWGGRLGEGQETEQKLAGSAYLLVSKGMVSLRAGAEEHLLKAGDGAIIRKEPLIAVKAGKDAELVLIDLPTAN